MSKSTLYREDRGETYIWFMILAISVRQIQNVIYTKSINLEILVSTE